MTPQYPAAIYTPRTKANYSGVVYDASDSDRIFAEDVSKDDAEIVAIETELGTTPSGTFDTVKLRLEDIEADIDDIEGSMLSNPMSAAGDIIVGGESGAPARLAKGDDGKFLKLVSGTPSWETAGGAPDYSVRLTMSGDWSFGSDSWTTMTNWDTETFDTDSMHSTSTNPARITFTHAGKYCFGCNGSFVSGTGHDVVGVRIKDKNGNVISGQKNGNYVNSAEKYNSCSGIQTFAANDYIYVEVYARSGSDFESSDSNFWAYLIATT